MNYELYTKFLFSVVAVYVIFGNYLYLRKVVPALDVAPGFLPTTQFKHIGLYLKLIQAKVEKPWFFFFLKYIKEISILIFILMIPGFFFVFKIK
jgi:hypothetical protein